MSLAVPLLAALLDRALPGLAVLDLGAGLFPWLPGARPGLSEAAALPAAERALLRPFRRGAELHPLFGVDPAEDSALLAGAPAAWGHAPHRLVALPGPPSRSLLPLLRTQPGPLLLLPGEAGEPPGEDLARILLLLGDAARIEGRKLLLPPARLPAVFEALRGAAAAVAEGDGWQLGGRLLSSRMASLTLLTDRPDRLAPAVAMLPAEALVHDGPLPAAGGRLPLGTAPRLRLLLGHLPPRRWSLRIALCAGTPGLAAPPVPFLDGLRVPATAEPGPDGTAWLDLAAHPTPGRPTVLGLALPRGGGPGGLALAGIGIRP
jgi:hypothetical protein